MSSDLTNSGYVQFNSPQEMVSYGGLDTVINPPYMGLKRSISAHVSVPETYLHSSSFTVGLSSLNFPIPSCYIAQFDLIFLMLQQLLPSSTWEGDFQNLLNLDFDQVRATSFPSHLSSGN